MCKIRSGRNLSDKLVSAPMDGLDDPLLFAAVANRFARHFKSAVERTFRYDPAVPQIVQQFIAGHDPVPIFHQVDQQIEHLRFNRLFYPITLESIRSGIKREIAALVDHVRSGCQAPISCQSAYSRSNPSQLKSCSGPIGPPEANDFVVSQ